MLDITAFIIIIFSISIILIILSRKLPKLKEIKIEDVDREKKTKLQLVEQRLLRNIRKIKENFKLLKGFKSAAQVNDKIKKAVLSLKDKKEKYVSELKAIKKERKTVEKEQEKKFELDKSDKNQAEDNNDNDLDEIKKLVKKGKLEEAEDLTIELIKSDPKCLEAYKILWETYFKRKNFTHAEATLEHIVQLADRLKEIKASDYLQLEKDKLRLEKIDDALQNAKKAVLLEPLNPKIIHFVTEAAIVCNQKDAAWKYYKELKKIDPDNNSLDELLEKLKGLH